MKLKKIRRILLGVLVGLVVLAMVGWMWLDAIAKTAVEKGSTYALGVETNLDSMSLSLLRGRMVMDGLRIANPEGFSDSYLMKSGTFDVDLKTSSIFSDTIVLNKFELDGLELNIEQRVGGTNISKIMDNLKKFESEKEEKEPSGKKVQIDTITIRNVVVHYKLVSGLPPVTIKLPEVVLEDVASDDSGGIIVAELVGKMFVGILKAVVAKSEGLLPADLLRGVGGQVASAAEAVGEGVRDIAGEGGKNVKSVLDKLGTILRKKTDDE